MSHYLKSAAYRAATAPQQTASIALVTGAKSGIGLALARKLASFPFVDTVLAVSRSITAKDDVVVQNPKKIVPVAADVTTAEGRKAILQKVQELCGSGDSKNRTKQLRFLIHSAGTIDPIKPVLDLQPDELRKAMLVNCEGPLFLTTALHPYMQPLVDNATVDASAGQSGRVLHVSSGAAHGAPPIGWAAYGITKAAFVQTFRVLEREFRDTGVVVGSFKPGVVDTAMQGVIRSAPPSAMPIVDNFKSMKEKSAAAAAATVTQTSDVKFKARPPPNGALDSPDNVACFAEFLLLGTTDEEFANAKDTTNEWDIRNATNYPLWIADVESEP